MNGGPSLVDEVRDACRWVAERARSVRIERERILPYAQTLPSAAELPGLDGEAHFLEGGRDEVVAFVLCLDAINFGSGWWPTIRRREGRSGYFTMACGLTERFRTAGPWAAGQLAQVQAPEIAGVLGQDPGHELMALYAASLRDLGEHVRDEFDGAFTGVVDGADGSAVALAGTLARWRCFADVSPYASRRVPLAKRAQLTPADLAAAGVAEFSDLDRLTAFADNLVPHVLTLDGVLRLDPDLAARIDAGVLLEHDAPEEVELRGCTVHAVELLADATRRTLSPAQVDGALWNRGQAARYKARARPRARCTAY